MPARSFFGQTYTSLWSESEAIRSPVRFRRAVDRVENLKLAGTGRFRSNNRDRRFESILLQRGVGHQAAVHGPVAARVQVDRALSFKLRRF
jgi:hypothetical protein